MKLLDGIYRKPHWRRDWLGYRIVEEYPVRLTLREIAVLQDRAYSAWIMEQSRRGIEVSK